MPFIEVKQDPTIEHTDVVMYLSRNTTEEQVGEENYEKNLTDIMQTSLYGILCPIIMIGGIVVRSEDIVTFELNDKDKIPSVNMLIHDRYGLTQYFDTPGADNELRVEILPPFENAYRKINLTFFITSFSVIDPNNDLFSVKGSYKLPALTDSQYKSYGQISTYKLFEEVAKETKLGFATNVEDTDDKKMVYNNFNSYMDILSAAVKKAGGEDCVYEWFIDCWDYLTLIDIKDRLTTIVHDEDNQVWISNQVDEISAGVEIIPYQVVGTLTNLFGANESQLFVREFRKLTKSGNNKAGTDKVVSTYRMDDSDYTDTYLGNQDVQDNLYKKYVYTGEVYGDYDYKTAAVVNESFYQKLGTEMIEVDLNQPLLALCRGEKINFECYYDDEYKTNLLKEIKEDGALEENTQTVINTEDPNPNNEPNKFKLDVTVTGQYVVMGNRYKFSEGKWTHTCLLARPVDQKVDLLNLSGGEATAQQQQEQRYSAADLDIKMQNPNQKSGGSNSNWTAPVDTKDKKGYEKWIACVQNMASFYQNNIHTYQGTVEKPRAGRKSYSCPLIGKDVQDDCSSLVRACLQYFGIPCPYITTALMQPGSKFDIVMKENGFQRFSYDVNSLKKGDIICGGPATHTEIYWANGKVMSWGSIHDGQGKRSGLPCGMAKTINYIHTWRYVGK